MIRGAVIGCGRMGAFTSPAVRDYAPPCWFPLAHAEALAAHPDVELLGLCDPFAETLERAQAHYGVPNGYADHAALLAEASPEIVCVATRTVGRAAIMADCIAAGARALHVEKPLCSSAAELAELRTLLTRDDVFVTLGTIRRFFPAMQGALALAESGDIGDLLEIRVNMGPRPLYWTHPHSIDLALMMANGRAVEAVEAKLSPLETDADGVVLNDPQILAATIWFAGGVACHIGRTLGNEVELSCASGRVMVKNDGWRTVLSEYVGDDPYLRDRDLTFDVADDRPQGTLAPMSQLVACLQGNEAARIANARVRADILTGQAILFAIVESHLHGGRPVTLDQIDPDRRILAATNGAPA